MRLIERFPTAATRPQRTQRGDRASSRSDGRPQPAVAPATPNASVESTHRRPATHPTTQRRSRARVTHTRRFACRVLLVVELVALALVLTSSSSAHADTAVLAIADSVTTVMNNVRNWIMGILAGLATVFLTIGGVRYVMGSGDPGEIEKAKTAFKSAGWGYGLAALAPLVVEILKGIVGA